MPEVNLVLARCSFLMARFDGYAQLFERKHGLPSQISGLVGGVLPEVASTILGASALRILEVEVFDLRPHIVCIAELRSAGEIAPEHGAGVALMRFVVGRDNVTKHPCNGILARAPRQHAEGVWVRKRVHVTLVRAHEALDGRPVEAHPASKRMLEFFDRDGKPLQVAQNVRKPEPYKLDIILPGFVKNKLSRFWVSR